MTCAAFNPVNPCLFAFADVSGSVGLRAIDRSLDAGLAGSAQVDVAVNCMGAGNNTAIAVYYFFVIALQNGHATESCWLWEV